jgi:hypothetical protein
MGRVVGALEAETQVHVKYIDEIIKVQCKELNLRKGVLQQTQRTLNLNVYRTHFHGKICRKPTGHTPHPVQNHWVTVELNNLSDFGHWNTKKSAGGSTRASKTTSALSKLHARALGFFSQNTYQKRERRRSTFGFGRRPSQEVGSLRLLSHHTNTPSDRLREAQKSAAKGVKAMDADSDINDPVYILTDTMEGSWPIILSMWVFLIHESLSTTMGDIKTWSAWGWVWCMMTQQRETSQSIVPRVPVDLLWWRIWRARYFSLPQNVTISSEPDILSWRTFVPKIHQENPKFLGSALYA